MPALLLLADWLIARYPGTHKADEELLRSGSVQGRLRSAVLVRAGERRLARRFKEEVLIILAREEGDRCHSAPSVTHPPVLACPDSRHSPGASRRKSSHYWPMRRETAVTLLPP